MSQANDALRNLLTPQDVRPSRPTERVDLRGQETLDRDIIRGRTEPTFRQAFRRSAVASTEGLKADNQLFLAGLNTLATGGNNSYVQEKLEETERLSALSSFQLADLDTFENFLDLRWFYDASCKRWRYGSTSRS